MKTSILILILIFIGSTHNISAQQRQLNREEFYAPIRAAQEKKFNASRREIMTLKVYSDGVLENTTTEIEEFLKPDKRRYALVETEAGKTRKLELIKIGNNYYQKKDDGNWTKENRWGRGISVLTTPLPKTSAYSVENTTINKQPAKLYKSRDIYNEINSAEETYLEHKVWINDKGFAIKEEFIMGKPSSKQITSYRVYEYQYAPNIKIVAPIK